MVLAFVGFRLFLQCMFCCLQCAASAWSTERLSLSCLLFLPVFGASNVLLCVVFVVFAPSSCSSIEEAHRNVQTLLPLLLVVKTDLQRIQAISITRFKRQTLNKSHKINKQRTVANKQALKRKWPWSIRTRFRVVEQKTRNKAGGAPVLKINCSQTGQQTNKQQNYEQTQTTDTYNDEPVYTTKPNHKWTRQANIQGTFNNVQNKWASNMHTNEAT